jgi:hypothetical protein
MAKPIVPPTLWQLYLAHVRSRAALLLSDATLLFLLVVGPIVLLIATRIMAAFGAHQTFLNIAEVTDGVWLVLAVGLICLDSFGKLVVISVLSWREVLQNKS